MRQSKFVNATPIGSRPCGVKFMRAKTLLVLTGVFFASFGWAQSSAQTDLFVGTWRFVPEESRSTPDITWKLKFAFENGQLREELLSARQSESNGKGRASRSILQFDGQEHPLEQTGERKHSKHTIVWKRIDDHTVEGRINHDDGKEYSTERFVISPDGKKLTLTMRTDGSPSESVIVFARQ